MNHHARLVLFLKGQGVITELEAEEYLNPTALGAGAGALQQPNLQARNMVRGGIVAHGVMLGVLLLFLGLIHVAPLGATPRTPATVAADARGHVRVDARPWARIYVDNTLAGVTPLARPLELSQGKHQLRFEHDWYQPITRAIDVTGDSDVSIDFEKSGVLKSGKAKP
jgi:hypothetical protein